MVELECWNNVMSSLKCTKGSMTLWNDGIRTGFYVGIMEYGLNWMLEIWDKDRLVGMMNATLGR